MLHASLQIQLKRFSSSWFNYFNPKRIHKCVTNVTYNLWRIKIFLWCLLINFREAIFQWENWILRVNLKWLYGWTQASRYQFIYHISCRTDLLLFIFHIIILIVYTHEIKFEWVMWFTLRQQFSFRITLHYTMDWWNSERILFFSNNKNHFKCTHETKI